MKNKGNEYLDDSMENSFLVIEGGFNRPAGKEDKLSNWETRQSIKNRMQRGGRGEVLMGIGCKIHDNGPS